jgi:XisI protein
MVASPQSQPVAETSSQQAHYSHVLITLLSQMIHPTDDVEVQTIPVFDTIHHHYQLLDLGWNSQQQRVFLPILHLDIIAGKVWVQENRTDVDIADLLTREGIKPEDIILGLHPPNLRAFGAYSVG